MNLLIEQIIVGIFTTIIYLFLLPFGLEYYILLFLDGFLKHILGHYLGIQSLFCNKYKPGSRSIVSFPQIILEAIIEGIIFVIFGLLLVKCGISHHLAPYIIAFSIHILTEFTGIHYLFIKHRCN
jgi:hypothetical protein